MVKNDEVILRELAEKVAEVAVRPEQNNRRQMWYKHNALQPTKPLVLIYPENSWGELLPESQLQCQDPLLRGWERELRRRLYAGEHFQDDRVLDDRLQVGYVYATNGWAVGDQVIEPDTESAMYLWDTQSPNTGWGVGAWVIESDDEQGAYRWDSPIKEKSDLDKLRVPSTQIDYQATQRNLERAEEIFDGLLRVELVQRWFWSLWLTGDWAFLRGIEQMMWDMVDDPAFTHPAMRKLLNMKLEWMDWLEQQGLFSLNSDNDDVGSGGLGFSNELPGPDFDGRHVRYRDMWGTGEAQEAVGLSPAMWDEFVLEYHLPFLERFGLTCFGCCEPLHDRLEILKRRVPNLRRISVSPWAKRRISAESLQDKYIYSWKPNPSYIAAVQFDPDAVRSYIRETLEITRGCILEMILKDTHTCNNEPKRFALWAQIAQEEAQRAAERL